MDEEQLKAMSKSHAELEQWHYKALENPSYRMEGMLDVLREEMMMNMPLSSQEFIPEPIIEMTTVPKEKYNQILGEVNYLKRKVEELSTKKKKSHKWE